ncbi:MAG TPA: RNA polymerase sigma factor [Hyphomonadaceae bacterium]|nr:RNA polymerase sigma factor [Hyphomonadaceae bacterium]
MQIAIKLSRSSGKGLDRRGANGSPGVRDFTVGVASEETIAGPPAEAALLRRNRVDRLYRAYASALIAWLRRRYGGGPPEPEDVAQAAFLRFAGLASADHIEDERAFLFTIAANLAVSGIRKRCSGEAFIAAELATMGGETEKITPERVYASKARFKRLSVAFAALSERQKDMVIRCRIRGQTYAEIVAETGWSLGVVAADVKAAMLALARSDGEEL